jgi:hypothetical protein
MTTPAKYREYADAIWAASSSEVRAALLSMARRWFELAERAERQEPSAGAGPELAEKKKPPVRASAGGRRGHETLKLVSGCREGEMVPTPPGTLGIGT